MLVVDLSKMAFEQIIMESIGFQEIFERIKVNYKTAFLLGMQTILLELTLSERIREVFELAY